MLTLGAIALGFAASARPQQSGEDVEGVISSVDSRSLTVTRDGGKAVTARLGPRTRVVVSPRSGGHYPDATVEFLKPGMGVRFRSTRGVLDRVQVTSVPSGAWPGSRDQGN